MGRVGALLTRPGFRYLLVGGGVYVFELIVIVVAQALGLSAVWAVAVGFVLGTIVSFFLQKLVAFGDKRMHRSIVGLQFAAVCALVAWNFTFSLLLTHLLENTFPAVVTRTIALGVTTVWNFYLYKTRIFKQADLPLVD